MSWTQEAYKDALDFAATHHKEQRVPGSERSYVAHLATVAMEVMAALPHHPELDGNLALQCALLHDVIEDTGATYAEVQAMFGQRVADGVLALTKNQELPKEQQMPDSLARIRQQPPEIAMIKLADRISNLEPPPYYWTLEKRRAYQAESRVILAELGSASAFLAARLAQRIDAYAQYFGT